MQNKSPIILSFLISLAAANLLEHPAAGAEPLKKPTKEEADLKAKKADAEIDAYFKSEAIASIQVVIEPSAGAIKPLVQLAAEPRKYVKATITEGDNVYLGVGVHLRGGLGSFRPIGEKSGFTINMDKFEGKLNFHGMDKWHLMNSAQDGSYISELISNEMLRAAGVPALRIKHAIVTVNGQTKGFYCLKEGYDSHFFKRNFPDPTGNFYDGGSLEGGVHIWQRDIDNPLELLRGKGDVKDRADLKALVAACREPDAKKRWELLEKLLDMDVFISGFCIQAILGDWDGYVFHKCNYRVYHDPKRNKLVFLPSGLDQEFGNPDRGPLVPPMQGMVARAVYNTPEGKAKYLQRMAEINTTIMNTEKWLKRIDELQARLQPAITSVDAKAGAEYPNQIKRIRDFLTIRPKSIERQLKSAK